MQLQCWQLSGLAMDPIETESVQFGQQCSFSSILESVQDIQMTSPIGNRQESLISLFYSLVRETWNVSQSFEIFRNEGGARENRKPLRFWARTMPQALLILVGDFGTTSWWYILTHAQAPCESDPAHSGLPDRARANNDKRTKLINDDLTTLILVHMCRCGPSHSPPSFSRSVENSGKRAHFFQPHLSMERRGWTSLRA